MKANPNVYSNFLENLYNESPRAAYALESMKFNLMAQIGLDEVDALEVVSKLVAAKVDRPAHATISTASKSLANGKANDTL